MSKPDSNCQMIRSGRPRARSRGVTLIELMVALVISLVLIGGAIQVYVYSRQNYDVNESVAQLQETARYALSVLEPDIRMANSVGTAQGPVRRGPRRPASTPPCTAPISPATWRDRGWQQQPVFVRLRRLRRGCRRERRHVGRATRLGASIHGDQRSPAGVFHALAGSCSSITVLPVLPRPAAR